MSETRRTHCRLKSRRQEKGRRGAQCNPQTNGSTKIRHPSADALFQFRANQLGLRADRKRNPFHAADLVILRE